MFDSLEDHFFFFKFHLQIFFSFFPSGVLISKTNSQEQNNAKFLFFFRSI